MKLVNLTPHDIHVYIKGQQVITIPPQEGGPFGRLIENREYLGSFEFEENLVSVNRVSFGKPENLPEPEKETYYIVSRFTAEAIPERRDLLFPDKLVRDSEGVIVGCQAFGRP